MLRKLSLVLLALLVAQACDDLDSVMTPLGADAPLFARIKVLNAPVCETIEFTNFAHGDLITTVPSGFGFDITLTTTGNPGATDNLRAWDTDTPQSSGYLDTDLMWDGEDATCADCNGQGITMIIEDEEGFDYEGDSSFGGEIVMTGFTGQGTFLIRSYVAIDQEGTESAIRLFVDGTEDGASSGLGDGSVETVVPIQKVFNDEATFVFDGSGTIDDIELCRAPEGATGRMTGGGRQITIGDLSVTRGFTIHCDLVLSNNVEINWPSNKWHIDKPLTSAECFDDGALDPVPPAAPFDTFIGEGFGRLNGVDGSFLRFTFVDAGEPGRNDHATIQIWAPGADPEVDAPVLDISDNLTNGNIQAHFDQPHGSNQNRT